MFGQIRQPILLPDELSEILANLSVSPDTALRHIDALMGREVDKIYNTEENIYTYENAADYIDQRKY